MTAKTDWRRIGLSGPTADGREIKPEWIDEMAETYNADVYQALIWPDHMRFNGNFGEVLALKAENHRDPLSGETRRALYAQLAPKPVLISMNRNGSYLFGSMEISPPNFANTGKRYFVGLGVTDEPASLSVEKLQFSQARNPHGNQFSGWTGFDLGEVSEPDEQVPGWFARMISKFGGMPPVTQEDDDMTKEQLEQLTGAMKDAIGDGFAQVESAIAEKFAALNAGDGEEPPEDEHALAPIMAGFEALKENYKTLEANYTALKAEFEELKKTPAGGTQLPEHVGATMEHYS